MPKTQHSQQGKQPNKEREDYRKSMKTTKTDNSNKEFNKTKTTNQ